MASPALLQTIQDGYPNKSVPEQMYDSNLKSSYEALLASKGISAGMPASVKFDPYKHLKYYANEEEKTKYDATNRISMNDLNIVDPNQISTVGVSDPFPLFTDEAIEIMRQEFLQKELFLKYAKYCFNSTSGLDANLRGYVKNDDVIETPFIHDAWTHPKTMELISRMAGVELEIVMDQEIAHVNISMKSEEQAAEERIQQARTRAFSGSSDGEDIPAVVGWHKDSYPFVCVLMVSDTSMMIGGETCLRKGKKNGDATAEVIPVSGPSRGNACVLQGGCIEHIAPTPLGASERITMVTSFRAKDPTLADNSCLNTVKPEINFGSRYHNFYPDWIKYRSELVKQRLDLLNDELSVERKNGKFDKESAMDTLKDISAYLARTFEEMEINDQEWDKIINNN